NKLSPNTKSATLYELLTKGKYSESGHGLNPTQIGKSWQSLKANVRESLSKSHPEIVKYFEQLKNKNEHVDQLKNSPRDIENRQEKISKLNEQEKKINQSLSDELKKRYGNPVSKVKSIFSAISNISPLKAAGLGVPLYALHNLPAKLLVEGLGIS